MSINVIIKRLSPNTSKLAQQFKDSFHIMGLDKEFAKAKTVFIKPNLTYPSFKKGVTTRKEFIESLVYSLRQINETTLIYIGESEGGYKSFSMSDGMRAMGFYEIQAKFRNVNVVNLSKLPRQSITLIAKGRPYRIELPKIFFDEIDFSITCPLPKVHCMTRLSLSFKNQWGCLPDTMRLKNHFVFDEIIGQICDKLKFHYVFLDGKYGLDNNGPMNGIPVELNWFVAADSLGAFDMVVSEMMGNNWRKISHMRAAERYGYLPERDQITVIGDIEALKKTFRLKRTLWNYPALAAFRSKRLTQLFYFSALAKLLHDVMYLFRKKAIN